MNCVFHLRKFCTLRGSTCTPGSPKISLTERWEKNELCEAYVIKKSVDQIGEFRALYAHSCVIKKSVDQIGEFRALYAQFKVIAHHSRSF